MPKQPPTYLGDGVFAEFDGFNVWVWASDGLHATAKVAFNNANIAGFLDYYARCTGVTTKPVNGG